MPGIKHLIQCHCILPQFRKLENPIFHKFVVFSKTEESGDIIKKIARCNNCGVVHSVFDFCKSEVVTSLEDTMAIVSIEDLRNGLSKEICSVLEDSKSDISTWEQIDDIFESQAWGSEVVLTKQEVKGETHLKVLNIISENRFKIRSRIRQDTLEG